MRVAEVRERLKGEGAEVVGSTPAEFVQFIQRKSERYGKILKESGIRLAP